MASGLDQWVGKLEGHNEIGEALTQQLQKAEDEVQQFIGGRHALKLAADKVGALGSVIEEDLNAGKLSFDSELKAAEYIKKTIIRARELVLSLADVSQSKEMVASGKVVALKESRDLVMRHTMAAKARAEQLVAAAKEVQELASQAAPEAEEPSREPRQARVSGQHPGRSSLDDRRIEAAIERQQAETSPLTEPPAPPTEGEPTPPKRRGRPPKVNRDS